MKPISNQHNKIQMDATENSPVTQQPQPAYMKRKSIVLEHLPSSSISQNQSSNPPILEKIEKGAKFTGQCCCAVGTGTLEIIAPVVVGILTIATAPVHYIAQGIENITDGRCCNRSEL